MSIDIARQIVEDALRNGLKLHGVSANGRPAISFDYDNPAAEAVRQRFLDTSGLFRELLRAAMIEHCQASNLPQDLSPEIERFNAMLEERASATLH